MKLAIIKERARVGVEFVFRKKKGIGLSTKTHQFSPIDFLWINEKSGVKKSVILLTVLHRNLQKKTPILKTRKRRDIPFLTPAKSTSKQNGATI